MDEFKFNKVFSSIDENGRYSFFNQVPIAKWNIFRLAECLLPLIDTDQEKAVKIVENEILDLMEKFDLKRMKIFAKKIGIKNYEKNDDHLILDFLKYIEKESLDFTLAFRNLEDLYFDKSDFYPKTEELNKFTIKWKNRVSKLENINKINPIYIPRNHQVQKVIDDAYKGDISSFHQLIKVTSDPFKSKKEYEDFSKSPKPDERVYQTFCGT